MSDAAYALHYQLEHYSRWVRHSQPSPHERDAALSRIDPVFIQNRIALGSLQNEVDAFFGKGNPGQFLHRLTDLGMVKYLQLTSAPPGQLNELRAAVAGDEHTGLSADELLDENVVRAAYSSALSQTLNSILVAPIGLERGFASTKLLTGPDGLWAGLLGMSPPPRK